MAKVQLTSTTTKPAGTPWFNQAAPEKIKQLNDWVKLTPGLLVYKGKELSPTSWQNVYKFLDKESCDAFLANLNSHAIHLERMTHLETYGQVTNYSITDIL